MDDGPVILALGVDFQRVEAAIVHTADGAVYRESMPLGRASAREAVYLEPSQVLAAALGGARRLVELKPREARRIAAVSLIGRSATATYVSQDGAQAPFLLPEDPRVAAARAAAVIEWGEVAERVGLTRGRCQAPFALKACGKPQGRARALTPKDFVKWALTGEFSTDPLDAQYSFLWDLGAREWSDELCGVFGIPKGALVQVLPAAAVAGRVTEAAARATGIKAGTPVASGLGDWGEFLGGGAFLPGDAFEHIGATGAFYGVMGERPPAGRGLDVRPHVIEGKYLAGRQGLPGGACLEWFLKKSSLAPGGIIDWTEVEHELEAAAMGRPENILFFPTLSRREAQMADAALLNLRQEDDLTGVLQGVMEGIFFTLKSVCEEMRAFNWSPKSVFTTGQIAFKHAPRRMRANIYGLPIYAGRAPGANVVSAALAGAVAAGIYADYGEARKRMLNLDGGAAPDPATRAQYEGHFASWLGARNFLMPGEV